MCRWTLRILAPLALLAPLAGSAEAGVGDSSVGALSPFGRLSLVQTVQYGGDCWYDNGANGPGYYPCGDEWNNALGGGAPILGPAIRRHHHRGVVVAHPQALNPVYRGAPSRRLGAGGVRASPKFHAGAATGTPGFAGGGFHGGGSFHHFRGAGVPHIGAPVSPGVAGVGTFRAGGAFAAPHIGAPVSPGIAGVGTFRAGGAFAAPHIGAPASPGVAGIGTFRAGGAFAAPHIGAPASPGVAGIGTFRAGGAFGAPHIGAPASPGLAGGGFHGVGAGGAFQAGGIGHR